MKRRSTVLFKKWKDSRVYTIVGSSSTTIKTHICPSMMVLTFDLYISIRILLIFKKPIIIIENQQQDRTFIAFKLTLG